MDIHTVLSRLNNVKQNKEHYICACPVCGDDHHLYITPTADKILFYCQKCNAGFDKIVPLLDLPSETHLAFNEIIEQYDHIYKKPDGTPEYYKTRTKYANGKKKFVFYHYQNNQKVFSKPPNCNCLYNIDRMATTDAETTLYIVEGEKCADIMTKKGFLCTTANTGGGTENLKFSAVDFALMDKFNRKIVIPDNDDVGKKYAEKFVSIGAQVLNLYDIWDTIKSKQDVYDYIQSGQDIDKIRFYSFVGQKDWVELDHEDLINEALFKRLMAIQDPFERTQAETRCQERAREFKLVNAFNQNYKQYKIKIARQFQSSNGFQTDFPNQAISLNCGEWIADGYGVKRQEININNGNAITKTASPIPILPTAILQNIDSGIEKIKLEFFKDNWKSVICERSKAANKVRIIELADIGIEVNSENSALLVRYIADCVSLNLDRIPRYKSISRMGWIGNQFMPYSSEICFDGESENKYLYEAIRQKGSYEKWKSFVGNLRKNLIFRLQMAAAFASPIIEKVGALPFVLHLWGGTGNGKTVGMMAAMSIWGDPKVGKLVRTMNMTANSMMATSAFLHNIPFAGDELQTIKSRWENYDQLIMRITEGVDRGRMFGDKNSETKTWKCAYLFTGEEPCVKYSSGGGVKNRVIEIECQDIVVENGNEVLNFINENYGYAGIEIINGIRNEPLQSQYKEIFNEILSLCETTEKQAMAMALMLLGDRMACKYIFTDETPIEISQISKFLVSPKDIDVTERAFEWTINLIAKNQNRFTANNFGEISGEIWGKIKENSILINKDVLSQQMSAAGFEFDAMKSKWAEKGYLIKNSQGRLVHHSQCWGIKAMYIELSILDETKELKDGSLPFE